jgi:hypothetical protein
MGGVNPGAAAPTGQDWLSQLAPAHAPAAASLWPPAPGWWLLALAVIAAAALAWYWWRHPLRRLRQMARQELHRLETLREPRQLAQGLEQLMRRYALARFGHARVARLSGDDWLAFVVAHGGKAWAGEAGRGLLRAAYGSPAEADRAAWLRGARGFIGKA